MPDRELRVLTAGPQTTVQDLGRPGHAHLGVPRSGALDEPAHRLVNRLVGNPESAASLECLVGGLTFRVGTAVTLAVAGASVPLRVAGRPAPWGSAVSVPGGATVEVGHASAGLRAYIGLAGGVAVPSVLGSRATDVLSGLGPAALTDGDRLPLGERFGSPGEGVAVPARRSSVLRLRLGPRDDWFTTAALAALDGSTYTVTGDSNRIGLRLAGEPVLRARDDELPSEGMVLGAVQVPPDGLPVVFLHDHPVTGGYPVVGVVLAEDIPLCAQLRPGQEVRLGVVR